MILESGLEEILSPANISGQSPSIDNEVSCGNECECFPTSGQDQEKDGVYQNVS